MTPADPWGGLVTLALLSTWCHGPASPFLPAAFEPVLLAYGRSHPPLVVALVATAASLVAETINYLGYGWLLHRQRLGRVRRASAGLTRLFARRPFLACLLVAATPLPDWSARILGVLARYPMRRYLVAFGLGRLPLFWALAGLGQALRISTWTAVAVAGASVLATVGGGMVGRWRAARGRREVAGVLRLEQLNSEPG